ncbi:MAG: glutamate synthase subunit beta [Anaerolineaceae bacterium]|nr:glutamate synthase subunit beta [Anaerolineaceae bacterium]
MGKATGFMDHVRMENPYRDADDRLMDFEDLHVSLSDEDRKNQASRCMNCGVPFCQSDYGCPLHNLIPEWNDLLWRGREYEAFVRLMQTAPFPEFTGRVCPALCEKACNLADDGVTNRDNELYLIETGFDKGWVQPRRITTRSGKNIAVIGSGPSGLAAADLLNHMGHEVTVIEREDRPGGLLMYGIPNMKLPKKVIYRRIYIMREEGIHFLLNTEADPEKLKNYDAVLFCGGAKQPRRLNVENDTAPGVHFAVEYLTAATKAVLGDQEPVISAAGKSVIVVGGGDTGNDCVGTVLRQGCKSVVQLEMMPAPPENRIPSNPWPEWPRTLRTDYGQMEAISRQGADPRIYETTIKKIITDDSGKISAAETVCLKRTPEGRFGQISGTEKTLPCDLLLIAAGFTGCEKSTADTFNILLDQRGNMMPGDRSHHIKENIFSAGDMRTGQSLVVRALADGRAAALEINSWLRRDN